MGGEVGTADLAGEFDEMRRAGSAWMGGGEVQERVCGGDVVGGEQEFREAGIEAFGEGALAGEIQTDDAGVGYLQAGECPQVCPPEVGIRFHPEACGHLQAERRVGCLAKGFECEFTEDGDGRTAEQVEEQELDVLFMIINVQ